MSDEDANGEFFRRRVEYYRNLNLPEMKNSAGAWLWADSRIKNLEQELAELTSPDREKVLLDSAERLERQDMELSELREALQKIADGENNLGWSPCSYIAKQALLKQGGE